MSRWKTVRAYYFTKKTSRWGYKLAQRAHSIALFMLRLINIDNAYYCIFNRKVCVCVCMALCKCNVQPHCIYCIWRMSHAAQINRYLLGLHSDFVWWLWKMKCRFLCKHNNFAVLELTFSSNIFQPRSIMNCCVLFYFSIWNFVFHMKAFCTVKHVTKTSFQFKWLQPTSAG